ncbi:MULTISPECIES: hypothetical protein [unclassified Microbacterium]|uniref:hypothetical protein n=1 Tax=unclassified Microbacterium TaxID=2609290 RepID=UPI000EAA5109|nr:MULTISPECIES: hypothetical protein [unclassified Microbacterium]MBT2483368.1 hypothetical protein [Microbacterium sp. ISL-108]RKN66401.1 hypothetical protein D7252_01505 [Microbacterium sp. CGR2]
MTTEGYLVEYKGYEFYMAFDDADSVETTTLAPTLRVITGPWKTWRLDPGTAPDYVITLRRSVAPGNPSAEHPAGNLTTAESQTDGWVLLVDENGRLEKAPIGYAVYQRLPQG